MNSRIVFVFSLLLAPLLIGAGTDKRPLDFVDMMKFRAIQRTVVAEDGAWVALDVRPDRGDGAVEVYATSGTSVFTIPRGTSPQMSRDSRWVFATVVPEAVEAEKKTKGKDKPKNALAILDLSSGSIEIVEEVDRYGLSRDSAWLAYRGPEDKPEENEEGQAEGEEGSSEEPAPEEEPAKETGEEPEEDAEEEKKPEKKIDRGTITLRHLSSGQETKIEDVVHFSFGPDSKNFVCVVYDEEKDLHRLLVDYLDREERSLTEADTIEGGRMTHLTWAKEKSRLGYVRSQDDSKREPGVGSLMMWDGETRVGREVCSAQACPPGWAIPSKNELRWTRDGARLFFGFKEAPEDESESNDEDEEIDLFDVDALLEKRELDVWHWLDPKIIPHQKKQWSRVKDQTYRAVYHVDASKWVALATPEMPYVDAVENPRFTMGRVTLPYEREITWDGNYSDLYLVNLQDGTSKKVAERNRGRSSLSPDGHSLVFFQDDHWYQVDTESGTKRCLTDALDVPFFNEDHDYPSDRPSYGVGGWSDQDASVLIYDKYDIWSFSRSDGSAVNLTGGEGRKRQRIYRALRTDTERLSFDPSERLFLSAYHDRLKTRGFGSVSWKGGDVTSLLDGKKRFDFVAKAKEADVYVYTRQSYVEFPDLWITEASFGNRRKLTDINPQREEFAWGEAELVEWSSLDGIPLQGVLIKPEGYREGQRYPVLVYFYRFFSQRLHDFNNPVVNHRPCFPLYAGNGYAVFLPDIRFQIGRPGFASTKCLVPGVQKLVDMGVADPDAIGLHGHSWSGYQAAFMITQTDIFAAAVAGAPVSNMTSAYSGIRLQTGLARQFQYEKTQSRIGGTLWNALNLYIENSPVFFADRIETPLLIQFGDIDGAVPWQQGIELYLAMRRLGKECVFLQYRGEPHHLKKYPNKLDYAMKMKEYFDHYLKGGPRPDWVEHGVPYNGK